MLVRVIVGLFAKFCHDTQALVTQNDWLKSTHFGQIIQSINHFSWLKPKEKIVEKWIKID